MGKLKNQNELNVEISEKVKDKALGMRLVSWENCIKEILGDSTDSSAEIDAVILMELQKKMIIREAQLLYFEKLLDVLRREDVETGTKALAEKIQGWFDYRLGLYEYYKKKHIGEEDLRLLDNHLKEGIAKLKYSDLKGIYINKKRKGVKKEINCFAMAEEFEMLKKNFHEIKKAKYKDEKQALAQLKKKLPRYDWDDAWNIMESSPSDNAYEVLSTRYTIGQEYIKKLIGKNREAKRLLDKALSLRKARQ